MRTPPAPGARGRHASAESALRNGLTAATVAGGALALVVPTVAATTDAVHATDAPAMRLAADDRIAPAGPSGVGDGPAPAAVAAVPAAAATVDEDVLVLGSVLPVAHVDEPEPAQVDVAELLKAVGMAEVAQTAAKAREAREAAAGCHTGLTGLGRVKPWVRTAARFLSCLYGEPTLIGVAGRSRQSEHPGGLAVDFMMRGERGDRLAACALRNREALGVAYVIWRQRINFGDGWERMADRGGDTANHYDHVHISFERRSPSAVPSVDGCL
jgi:hypothetical protein